MYNYIIVTSNGVACNCGCNNQYTQHSAREIARKLMKSTGFMCSVFVHFLILWHSACDDCSNYTIVQADALDRRTPNVVTVYNATQEVESRYNAGQPLPRLEANYTANRVSIENLLVLF